MFFLTVFIVAALRGTYVNGVDLNSAVPRTVCYNETQDNCNTEFVDVYKHLSKSVTNLTVADTHMLLITRKNPEKPELLHKCGGRLPPNSNFDKNKKLIVVIHPVLIGYCDVAVFREWVNQLLKRHDVNIIVLDYSWGNHVDLWTSVLNARRIVRYQAIILLENIEKQTGISKKNITIIGHSLGAQIAGMVGATFHVGRIIGLDPAGPGYVDENIPFEYILDKSDADLVEILHTNVGKCLPHLGSYLDDGHVNFYINGGSVQKSCYEYAFRTLLRGDVLYGIGNLLLPNLCFHAQANVYFKVSIIPGDCQFVGIKCDNYDDFKAGKCNTCGPDGKNCLIMGFDTDKYITEIPATPERYFVRTTLACPYCDNSWLNLEGYLETYKSSIQTKAINTN